MEEDGLDQRDHVPASVVTGTDARYVDELRRHRIRFRRYTLTSEELSRGVSAAISAVKLHSHV